MDDCLLSLAARATGDDLRLEIKFDNQIKFSKILSAELEIIEFGFNDNSSSAHVMEIVLSGKQQDHTVIDSSGSIVSDRIIEISSVSLDNIQLGQIFLNKTIYTHDFNGTAEKTQQQFFGIMGCNGSVYFEFTSPVYLWLLENM
jgi:nicotinate-nucleotide pyrophosphorylase